MSSIRYAASPTSHTQGIAIRGRADNLFDTDTKETIHEK
jgi:hypothetical protein